MILPNIFCSYNYCLFAVDANLSKIASFRQFLCSCSTEFRIAILTSTLLTVFTGYWQRRTFAGMLFLSLLIEIGLFWPTTWHLFYFKKPAFEKHKAQNAKKLRNIARLRFRNLLKFFFDKSNNLWDTTNETNVNMFMYKVYLTHFMWTDDSINTFCNCWNALKAQGSARVLLLLLFFCFFSAYKHRNIGMVIWTWFINP